MSESSGTDTRGGQGKRPSLKKRIRRIKKRVWKALSPKDAYGFTDTRQAAGASKTHTRGANAAYDSGASVGMRSNQSAGNGKSKAKRTLKRVLRQAARGIFYALQAVKNFCLSLPPRILLVASSAFGFLVLTIIIVAIALPNNHRTSANAAETLAALSEQEQTETPVSIDSGTVDPYANYDPSAVEAAAATTISQSIASGDTAEFTQTLKSGDESAVVATIQTRLMELGYMDSDEPTEHFGPLTKSALAAFQRHNGLDDDGICGQASYEALMNGDAKAYVMQRGDSGEDVEGVQQRLYELGYLDNKANIQGTFGEKTEEAAKAFQKKNDLKVDGKVGSKTIDMLYGEDVVSNAYRLGDENSVIKSCQEALKKLGYLTFKADGVMGRATVTAIKSFQRANGLTSDGALGPVTRDLILSGDAQAMVIQLGDYGTAVKNVQKRLAELNYITSANATGYFGAITEDAVKAFQKRSGLGQDGKVGAVTLTMLNLSSAKKASTPASSKTESSSGGSSSSSGSSSSGSSSSGSSSNVAQNLSGVEKLIALAESKIGCSYVRGAKGPNSFDCSGFVYWCMKNAGVSCSYQTSIMWRSCSRYQKISSMSSISRGDILVFSGSTMAAGHVGIYLGSGKMIDASSSQGQVRKSTTVLKSGGYWENHFICAYRVF